MPIEPTKKIAVSLPARLIARIDRAIVDARERNKVVFTRSAVIRALIDLAMTRDEHRTSRRRSARRRDGR